VSHSSRSDPAVPAAMLSRRSDTTGSGPPGAAGRCSRRLQACRRSRRRLSQFRGQRSGRNTLQTKMRAAPANLGLSDRVVPCMPISGDRSVAMTAVWQATRIANGLADNGTESGQTTLDNQACTPWSRRHQQTTMDMSNSTTDCTLIARWPVGSSRAVGPGRGFVPLTWAFAVGAGDENRTRVASLEVRLTACAEVVSTPETHAHNTP